jgi:hypothetical protein
LAAPPQPGGASLKNGKKREKARKIYLSLGVHRNTGSRFVIDHRVILADRSDAATSDL